MSPRSAPLFVTPKVPLIEQQIAAAGLPVPEREVLFASSIGRRWRFDYGYPDRLLALEIEGMPFGRMVETASGEKVRAAGGRHSTGTGLTEDAIKYSWAAILGWCVVRATTTMVRDGVAITLLQEAFKRRAVAP